MKRRDIIGVTISEQVCLAAGGTDLPTLGRRVRIHTLPQPYRPGCQHAFT